MHHVQKNSAEKAPKWLKNNNLICDLVFLDPPFGVLDEAWDNAWSVEFWSLLFKNLYSYNPKVVIVVFLAEQQVSDVQRAASLNGFAQSSMVHWLKTGHWVSKPGRRSHPVNPILLLWHDVINYKKTGSYLQNGNFVATPKFPLRKHCSEVVNVTEKPVILLRSFISQFCSDSSCVADLTCGSGSAAIAAASLGIDSCSFDIREEQVEATKARLQEECASPSWYPSPEVVHDFSSSSQSSLQALSHTQAISEEG